MKLPINITPRRQEGEGAATASLRVWDRSLAEDFGPIAMQLPGDFFGLHEDSTAELGTKPLSGRALCWGPAGGSEI
jgi:hypothetical protein